MTLDPYRLPRTVIPARYELMLRPDLPSASFVGECSTEVEVIEKTDEVVLNALDLDIHEAWLETPGPNPRRIPAEVRLDADTERCHLLLAAPIEPGTWYVNTRFSGVLNDKLHGFYRSTFTDDDGTEHTIATTQMEATHARRAFPCWDEPELKAVFAVTLEIDPVLEGVSNARELSRSTTGDGLSALKFADSMAMSTYLVAFVVGPLEHTAPVTVRGVDLRVVHRPGQGHLTAFALEVGAFALEYLADYYDIAYPGDKLDLVAIPDFAFGAMENMGCVTFRDVLLLVDPETVTQPELQNVVDVIAHELAHMWFGNLVTMKWWNGIWLNEAFATFMEMKTTDAFRPEWERWTAFGTSRTAAFDTDSLMTTRPIEFEVVSPDDAEAMFDILTYEKGAAVVRMLEQYLGEDRFRAGIADYLRRHEYANTETTDLWDAVEGATTEPARDIMDSWIFQGGYPLVRADRDGDTLRLSQQRFVYLEDQKDEPEPSWMTPVHVAHRSNGAAVIEKHLLSDEVTIELPPGTDHVLVNAGGSGFFRVRYDEQLLAALARHGDDLPAIDRYNLVDDAWAAVLAGHTAAPTFLALAESFSDETDLSVWQRIIGSLSALDRILDGPARDALAGRVRSLVAPARERVEADALLLETDRGTQLRALLYESLAVLGGDTDVVTEARYLWESNQGSPGEAFDPSMLAATVNIIATVGGRRDFDDFRQRFRQAGTPQEELRFLGALAEFDDPDLVGELLDMTLTDTIRTQNAPYVIRRTLTNRTQGPAAWAFVADNWTGINDRFPSNSIVRLVEGVRSLSAEPTASDVVEFFEHNDVPQGRNILAQHLERLQVNVRLRAREATRLAEALTGP